jgi:hypothetical protein
VQSASASAPTASSATALPAHTAGLTTGAKAGIGSGIAVAAAVICVLAVLLWRKRRQDPNGYDATPAPAYKTPAMGTTPYYANDPSKSSVVSPLPQFSPGYSPGPYVHEAPSDGGTAPYLYPAPSGNGYEAMAPQELGGETPAAGRVTAFGG